MNQFKLTGTIKMIGAKQDVSEKFSKREFVVTINESEKYPQDILLQLTNAKCDDINSFMEGQGVDVSFNLRGRAWTSPQGEVKFFNTLEAWRVELSDSSASTPTDTASAVVVEDDGDLPF
jgi:hypothetical protein